MSIYLAAVCEGGLILYQQRPAHQDNLLSRHVSSSLITPDNILYGALFAADVFSVLATFCMMQHFPNYNENQALPQPRGATDKTNP
ncbi:MAG TPA: hypothetical protein VF916_15820 [Ktedonobacterales bacterium]